MLESSYSREPSLEAPVTKGPSVAQAEAEIFAQDAAAPPLFSLYPQQQRRLLRIDSVGFFPAEETIPASALTRSGSGSDDGCSSDADGGSLLGGSSADGADLERPYGDQTAHLLEQTSTSDARADRRLVQSATGRLTSASARPSMLEAFGSLRMGAGWTPANVSRSGDADLQQAYSQPGGLHGRAHSQRSAAALARRHRSVVVRNPELDEFSASLRAQFSVSRREARELPAIVLNLDEDNDGASGAVLAQQRSVEASHYTPGNSRPLQGGMPSILRTGALPSIAASGEISPEVAASGNLPNGGTGPAPDVAMTSYNSDDAEGDSALQEVLEAAETVGLQDELSESAEPGAAQGSGPPARSSFMASLSRRNGRERSVAPEPADVPTDSDSLSTPGFLADELVCTRFPTRHEQFLRGYMTTHKRISRESIMVAKNRRKNASVISLAPLLVCRDLSVLHIHRDCARLEDFDALTQLTALSSLRLKLNWKIRSGVEGFLRGGAKYVAAQPLWTMLLSLTQLHSLDLSGSTGLSIPNLQSLSGLTGLRSLSLVDVPLQNQAADALATLTELTQLRIPGMQMRDDGLMSSTREHFKRFRNLVTSLPNLEHLDVFSVSNKHSATMDEYHLRALALGTQLRRLDIAKLSSVTDRDLSRLRTLTRLTALKMGCNTWDPYRIIGRAFTFTRHCKALTVLHMEACTNLQNDAYVAIACCCPELQLLHIHSCSKMTAAVIDLTLKMENLEVLELLELINVPDDKISEVVQKMPKLVPGTAQNLIDMKSIGCEYLLKFNEGGWKSIVA